MALSRREKLKNLLVLKFSEISTDNGYRTTPLPVIGYIPAGHAVQGWPQICVVVGGGVLTWLDDPRTLSTMRFSVLVRGYFNDETSGIDENIFAGDTAGEPLLHDMLKVFHSIASEYLEASDAPWNIMGEDGLTIGPITPYAANMGYVDIQFNVLMRRVSSTFE